MIRTVVGQSWIHSSSVTIWNLFVVFAMITNKIIPTVIVCLAVSFAMVERLIIRMWRITMIHQATPGSVQVVTRTGINVDVKLSRRGSLTSPIRIIVRTRALVSLYSSDSVIRRILDGRVGAFAFR